MAKRSNKTEQVLKLITKDEETLHNMLDKENQEVEISVKEKPGQELKYEAKLKIEIDPEIQIKSTQMEGQNMAICETSGIEGQNMAICETSGMEGSALIEKSEHLINVSEVLVKEKLLRVMGKMNVCSCEACTNDVLALTLNILPAKYVTTDGGEQYSQLELYKKQYETDVLSALTRACVRVKVSPRHK